MGWRSDWLYKLIFAEVERVWNHALRDGRGQFGPAPTALWVRETREANWEQVQCRGDAQRQWIYRGNEPEALSLAAERDTGLGERRGTFYERGVVSFHISADRRRVLFTYILGPRYGRGMILEVDGQGTTGSMSPGEGPNWVS